MTSPSKDLITIRPSTPEDINFVYATWLPGLYFGNSWFKEINRMLYYKKYHAVIDGIIKRPNITVSIACLKEDPDVILGYAITEIQEPGIVLHWVFTRPVWRNLGIAKQLLPKDIVAVTHLTKIGKNLKPPEWVFDPFLV